MFGSLLLVLFQAVLFTSFSSFFNSDFLLDSMVGSSPSFKLASSSVVLLDRIMNRLAYRHTHLFLGGLASTLQFIIWSPLRHTLLYEQDALGYPLLTLHFPKEAFRSRRQRIAHQVDKGADSVRVLYITLSFATS